MSKKIVRFDFNNQDPLPQKPVISTDKKQGNSGCLRILLVGIAVVLLGTIYDKITGKPQIQNTESASELSSRTPCENPAVWGNSALCLPEISDWKNVINNDAFSQITAQFSTPGNDILAVYLRDSVNADSYLDSGVLPTPYITISGMKNYKDKFVYLVELTSVQNEQASYCDENWNSFKEFLDDRQYGLEFEKPVLLEKYELTKNSNQLLMLMKFGGSDVIVVGILNNFLVDNKLYQLNYYTKYVDKNSVIDSKALNDYFMRKILDANKN